MPALAVIHNFICIHDSGDNEYIEDEDKDEEIQNTMPQVNEGRGHPADKRGRAAERREQITHAMWRDYRRSD